MTNCRERAEVLRQQLKAQLEALEGVAQALAGEAEHLRRRDQARQLRSLKKTVSREVTTTQGLEVAAYRGFTEGRLLSGVVLFAWGGLVAAVAGRAEHPLAAGGRWAEQVLAKEETFGTVVVAVGSGGIPDDVVVVSLSRLARESSNPESRVEERLRHAGHALFSPDAFAKLLEELENRVLDGTLDLPVAAPNLPAATHRLALKVRTQGSEERGLEEKSSPPRARLLCRPEHRGVSVPGDRDGPDRDPDGRRGQQEDLIGG